MIYYGCLYFSVLPEAHAVMEKIVGSSQSPPEMRIFLTLSQQTFHTFLVRLDNSADMEAINSTTFLKYPLNREICPNDIIIMAKKYKLVIFRPDFLKILKKAFFSESS